MAEKLFDESGAVLGPGTRPADAGVAAARERVQINRELEKEDAADAGLAEATLRAELSPADFEQGRRMLVKYLDELSPEERGRIERATTKAGARALHDPTTLRALGRKALGEFPRTREGIDAELAAARKRMRDDPTWFSDDKAQLRYRVLVQATQGQR